MVMVVTFAIMVTLGTKVIIVPMITPVSMVAVFVLATMAAMVVGTVVGCNGLRSLSEKNVWNKV
jgi:hypothetical protein